MGIPLPTGVEVWGSPEIFFLNFYIKIVSFRAFWLAISYRLADCLIYPNRKYAGIEFYWQSFQHFGK